MEENTKNIIKLSYVVCLIVVFGVCIAAIDDLKNDQKSHKTLEFFLIFLSILSIFFLTTFIDYFSSKVFGSYIKLIKVLSVIGFLGLIFLISFWAYDKDNFGSKSTKDDVRIFAIVIGVFGVLAMLLYMFMKYNNFGPESKTESKNIKTESIKNYAKQQIINRIDKKSKDKNLNSSKREAYKIIKNKLIKTNDKNECNRLLQYCSFLYNTKTAILNNIASPYGPYNAPDDTGGKIRNKTNLQSLYENISSNKDYVMIKPEANSNDVANNKNALFSTYSISFNNSNDYKKYSELLANKLSLTSSNSQTKTLLQDPSQLSFNDSKCEDLITVFPVTIDRPIYSNSTTTLCN